MKYVKVAILFFLGTNNLLMAQVPVINNQFDIGGSLEDRLSKICYTSDSSYLLIGYSRSNISGDKTENSYGQSDYWIVKTNDNGNIDWQITIGGSLDDQAFAGEQTMDGGYIIGGTSYSGISGVKSELSKGSTDYWIVKLNSTGGIMWQKTIGGSSSDELRSIHELPDGSFIVGGYSKSGVSGNKNEASKGLYDYWVLKLNSVGSILWQNTIGSSYDDIIVDIQPVSGGGFIVGGTSAGTISGDKTEGSGGHNDYWILKLNDIGDIVWQNTIQGASIDNLSSFCQTADGGVILAGSSDSYAFFDKSENTIEYLFVPSTDFWVVKLDSLGIIEWENTIGGAYSDVPTSIIESTNGYIIAGSSTSNIIYGDKINKGYGSNDMWIVYLDLAGSVIAQTALGGTSLDVPMDITLTENQHVIIGGYSLSNISGIKTENTVGSYDYWVLELDSAMIEYNFDIEWEDTIGGLSTDLLTSIVPHSDGSYLIGGRSNSGISGEKTSASFGDYDYWVVKYSNDGNVQWQKSYGGAGTDYLTIIKQTTDGGYILGGYSNSIASGIKTESSLNYDYWVIKINSIGDVVWQNTIAGADNDYLHDLIVLPDGNCVITGYSNSGISGDKSESSYGAEDYWILKLNPTGDIIWQKSVGGTGTDYSFRVLLLPDGNLVAVGYSASEISGLKSAINKGVNDYWMICLNNDGVVLWDKSYGSSLADYFNSAIIVDDGILLGGRSYGNISFDKTENNTGGLDLWFVKTDFEGNILWENTFGGPGNDYISSYDITNDLENGFIVASFTDSDQGGDKWPVVAGCTDIWLLKFDSVGNNLWQENFGDNSCEDIYGGIYNTLDQGFILGAFFNNDFWVIKLQGNCSPSPEICNSLDDNCNGLIDDGITETISITAGGPITFCQGGSVSLTATYSGATVQWKKNGTNIPGATSATYNVTTKGNYTCVTTSACDTVESTSIFVNVIKNPNASISAGGPTTFCAGGSVVLTEVAVAGCTFQWYKGATPIAGATSLTYTATTSGNYKCRVTKAATGCYKNSNAIAVSVPCREGDNIIENTFSLYPNPANNFITIETDFSTEKTIYITDALGQIVKTITTSENNITIDLLGIASGIYFIKMEDGINSVTQKFVKK